MEIDTDVLELDLDYILLLTPAYYYYTYNCKIPVIINST